MKKIVFFVYFIIISLLLHADVSKFKMYEPKKDTIKVDTTIILNYDSPEYKQGFKDGEKEAIKQYKYMSCLQKIKIKTGIQKTNLPQYINKKNINYKTGFEDGFTSKTELSAISFVGLYLLLYYGGGFLGGLLLYLIISLFSY